MEMSVHLHTLAALPPTPIWYEARWAPEPWMRWQRWKFPAPARNRIPVVQPVA